MNKAAQHLTNFDLQRPAVLLCNSTYFRHWVSQVRGERSVDVWLQLEKELLKLSYSQMNLFNYNAVKVFGEHFDRLIFQYWTQRVMFSQ